MTNFKKILLEKSRELTNSTYSFKKILRLIKILKFYNSLSVWYCILNQKFELIKVKLPV